MRASCSKIRYLREIHITSARLKILVHIQLLCPIAYIQCPSSPYQSFCVTVNSVEKFSDILGHKVLYGGSHGIINKDIGGK